MGTARTKNVIAPSKLYESSIAAGANIMNAIDVFMHGRHRVGPQGNALKTLLGSVLAFNHADWDAYEQCLDPDVVMHNIGDAKYLKGRDAVMRHWRSQDEICFELTNNITWRPPTYPTSVRGVALWTHRSRGHVQAPIQYEFQFHPETFLLTSVWGEHSDRKDNL